MSWAKLFKHEISAIFTNPALLLTVFGGVLIYSFLYPLPYSQQLPLEQPVAVVNLDNSPLSREFERMVDATPQVRITERASSIEEAKTQVINNKVHGLFVIPEGFYRDLLLNKSPTLAYAGDASYFLVYGTIIEGLASAGGTLGAKAKVAHMVVAGDNIELAKHQYSPLNLNMRPVFNPTMGYVGYVVPAVFVFILHQTLLLATAMLGSGQNQPHQQVKGAYWLRYPAWQVLLTRCTVFLVIYALLSAYYFGFCFENYQVARLASITDLITMLVPFVLATFALGAVLGQLVPRPALATLIILLSSIPLVFSAGFVWPTTALPWFINSLAQLAPSTPAINGFLRLNQMGASFDQVIDYWGQMWILGLVYGSIATRLMSKARTSHTIS